jgi:trigger factor
MKTNFETISPVKKKLTVEVGAGEVDSKLNIAYRDMAKRAKIPGFRPGKAPKKILERYFGAQVTDDVIKAIISETFPKAVEEGDLFLLGTPLLEKGDLKAGEDFKYSATMEVRPEFELKDYLALEFEKEKCVIADEDVKKRLEQIQQAHGQLTTVEEDRPVKEGDYVIIEYEGFEGDAPIDGIKSSNFLLKVGSGDFHPQFENGLLGLKKGEGAEIDVDFEETYYHQMLAGKKARFKVLIHELKEMVLPELNDAFAGNFGTDFKDMKDLEKKVRELIQTEEEKRIDADLKKRLTRKIAEGVEFELPEVLVASEVDNALARVRENLMRSGSSLEKAGLSEEKLRGDFREDAENRVKEMLILGEIAKREDIDVDEQELSRGIESIAISMGQPAETIRKYYEARGLMDSLRATLMEEKTLNYLVEHASIKDVEKGMVQQAQGPES